MKRAAVPSILIAVVLLAVAVIAEAQQPKKVHRIGYLSVLSPSSDAARIEAFRQGLRELGMLRDRAWPSSPDIRKGSWIGSPTWRES